MSTGSFQRVLIVSAALWMLALCGPAAGPADAASSADFYKGRTVQVVVGFSAGGGYDLYARAFARHIGKHIPGNPSIIAQNMGGAAGLVGAKYLGEVAPRDGTILGYLTGSSQRFVSTPERFNIDFRSYEFIAAIPNGRIHFMRANVRPGMKTAADIVKAQDLVVGGLNRDGPKDLAMRLTLDILGVPYKYVTGYNSSAQAMLALQRGEISYYADSPPVYLTKVEPQVKAGELVTTYFDPGFDGTTFSVPKQLKGL